MVTWHGARTLGLPSDQYGIVEGRDANLVLLDAQNRFEAIRTRPKPRQVISRGRILSADHSQNIF
jgi:cytosine deaminase